MSEETALELEEKEYKFQPTDEDGRPIGGAQVIKYTTPEELAEKLREQNVLLIRKLRQETKKNRLGIQDADELSEDTQRFGGFTQFSPRELSDDERFDLSQKLQDPVTSVDAINAIIEARVGAPLDTLGPHVNDLEKENLSLRAKVEANSFVEDNPDYYRCNENFESITSWMVRYDLAPIKANFQKAYDTLKQQGVLILGAAQIAPIVEQPVPIVAPIVEQQPVRRVSTGLNNEDSSSVGVPLPPGADISYEYIVDGQKRVVTGLQAIAAMPGEEYKRRLLTDKEFGPKVDKLEKEARRRV